MNKYLLMLASALILIITSCLKEPYIKNSLISDITLRPLIQSLDSSGYEYYSNINPDSVYNYNDITITTFIDYMLAKQSFSLIPQAYAYQPGPTQYILQDSIESIDYYTLDQYNNNYQDNSNINTLLSNHQNSTINDLIKNFNQKYAYKHSYSSYLGVYMENDFYFKLKEAPTNPNPVRIYMIMKLYNNSAIYSDTISLKIQ